MYSNKTQANGLLPDFKIKEYIDSHNMIYPFIPHQVQNIDFENILSYGLSSYGYDVRLANEIKIYKKVLWFLIHSQNLRY